MLRLRERERHLLLADGCNYFFELEVEAAVLAAFAWLRNALLDEPVPGADAAAKARSLPACFAATSAIRRADLSVIAFESS